MRERREEEIFHKVGPPQRKTLISHPNAKDIKHQSLDGAETEPGYKTPLLYYLAMPMGSVGLGAPSRVGDSPGLSEIQNSVLFLMPGSSGMSLPSLLESEGLAWDSM